MPSLDDDNSWDIDIGQAVAESKFIDQRVIPGLNLPDEIFVHFFFRNGEYGVSLTELYNRCKEALVNDDEQVRCAALKVLKRLIPRSGLRDHDLIPLLLKAASDELSIIREGAVEALASFGHQATLEIVEAVVDRLDDHAPDVQIAAIKALPGFGPDLAGLGVTKLGDITSNGVNEAEKTEACRALVQLGSEAKAAVEALVNAAFKDSNSQISREVVLALVAIDPAGDLVPNYCKHPDEQVRLVKLLRGLGESGRELRKRIESFQATSRTFRTLKQIAAELKTNEKKVSTLIKRLRIKKEGGEYIFSSSQWAEMLN